MSDARFVVELQEELMPDGPAEFVWSAESFSWGELGAGSLATDATVRLRVALAQDERAAFAAHVHLKLERTSPSAPWLPVIGRDAARQVTEYLLSEGWRPKLGPPHEQEDVHTHYLAEAEWHLVPRPPETSATRWAGAARNVLERDLVLGSSDWMQDWPLEVSDARRIDEFLAYYDAATDDDVRFDTMALLLYCFDERAREAREPRLEAWFDHTLRRDFALHGQLVRYWSWLDRPVLDDENSWAISPQLRRIFWDGLKLLPAV